MLKVLVGVCAYNIDDYIEECLNSIVKQDYPNYEIIVIDDGSTDKTPEIIDRIAEKCEKMRVIHKANNGLAAGREQIVYMVTHDEIICDAIYWVDADDFIDKGAITRSVKVMEETGADIVKTPIKDSDCKYVGTYTKDEYMRLLLSDTKIKANIIGCLIKKEVYKGVHHRIGFTNEDYYVSPFLVENVNKIVVDSERNYIYRAVRPGSITYEGRSKFKGFYPRAMHRAVRYKRYKDEYPSECQVVLKQFTDYACMALMYSKKGESRAEKVREKLAELSDDIMQSPIISGYKKWLTREILDDGIVVLPLSILHKFKGNIKTWKDRLRGNG